MISSYMHSIWSFIAIRSSARTLGIVAGCVGDGLVGILTPNSFGDAYKKETEWCVL